MRSLKARVVTSKGTRVRKVKVEVKPLIQTLVPPTPETPAPTPKRRTTRNSR
jgi:hypothetical protein